MNHRYARVKKPLNNEMNVVPYIDVMLVLLVIFMVTAPMLTTGVEINLPKQSTATISTDEKLPIIISLTNSGALFISYEGVVDKAVDYTELGQIIDVQKQNDDALMVLINADGNNEYSQIMQLMAHLQAHNISQIGLLSQSDAQNLP